VWVLLPLCLFGGGLRFYWAYAFRNVYAPQSNAFEHYYEIGIAVLSNHAFGVGIPSIGPQIYRGPFFPSFIAGVESLFAVPSPGHIVYAQAILSTLCILVAYAMGRKWVSPMAGCLAAAWMALDLEQVMAISKLNIHGFYGIVLLALAWAIAEWVYRGSRKNAIVLGVLFAGSLLCRSSHYLLPLLLFGASFYWFRRAKRGVLGILSVFLWLCIFLSPLTLRNIIQFNQFVPLGAYQGAWAFLSGTLHDRDKDPHVRSWEIYDSIAVAEDDSQKQLTKKRELMRVAWRNIINDPMGYMQLCLKRVVQFWKPMVWAVFLGLFALLQYRKNKGIQALGLVALSLCGYGILNLQLVYGLAARPLLAVLAGCGLSALVYKAIVVPNPKTRNKGDALVMWAPAALLLAMGTIYLLMVALLGLEIWDYRAQRVSLNENLHVQVSPHRTRELVIAKRAIADSNNREKHFLAYSIVLRNHKLYLPARDVLLEMVRRFPSSGEGAEALVSLFQDMGVRNYELQKKIESIDYFLKALKLEPQHTEALLSLARIYQEEGDLSRALKAAEDAAQSTNLAKNRHLLSVALGSRMWLRYLTGDMDAANEDADRLVALIEASKVKGHALEFQWNSFYVQSLNIKALYSFSKGATNEGNRFLQQSWRLNPEIICKMKGYPRERIPVPVFDFCINKQPERAKLYQDRGVANFLLGRIKASEKDFRKAIELKANFAEAHLSLGRLLEDQGKIKEALAAVDAAVRFSNKPEQSILLKYAKENRARLERLNN